MIITLGVRTPPDALGDCAGGAAVPRAWGSRSLLDPAASAPLIEAYAKACVGIPWFVGGPGSPSVAEKVAACGGLAIEGDVARARSPIERMLHEAV